MATLNTNVECRLRWHARALLYIATFSARAGMKIPHAWVKAVANRGWQMRIGRGPWFNIQIDDQGRRVK